MKILMATGGSPYSQRALEIGGRLAKSEGAAVTVITVDEGKEPVDVEKAQEEAERILLKTGVTDPDFITRGGSVKKEILKESKNYDLLIMGALGVSNWKIMEKFLGNTAVHILEKTDTSTLVVRGKKPVEKVLAAVYAPKFNPKVLNYAGRISRAKGAGMRILNVKSQPSLYPFGTSHERTSEELFRLYPDRRESLEIAAETIKKEGVEVDIKMREGIVEEEIIREAREGGFDLIVVGSHGFKGFKALLFGSLPLTLARDSNRSVLVVMPTTRK